jgi:hypothetical protein
MANEQKQKLYICHDFNTLGCQSNFWHIKNKQIWIATVKFQRIAQTFLTKCGQCGLWTF